jgi:hypothetical protein
MVPAGFFIPIKMDKNARSPVRFPANFIEIIAFVYVEQGQVFILRRLIFQKILHGKLVFFGFGNYI